MKKLEKLDTKLKASIPYVGDVTFGPYVLASESLKILRSLNTVIDRINDLEARYEEHYHEFNHDAIGDDITTQPVYESRNETDNDQN